MEPEGLGLAIRGRRTALGLTIDAAAERAGMHAGAWGPIERQYVWRVPRRLPDIARALDTTPAALLAAAGAAPVLAALNCAATLRPRRVHERDQR